MSEKPLINETTIIKEHLINAVKKELNLNLEQSNKLVNAIINSIFKKIINANAVKIRKFGTFSVMHKKLRMGRNPKTMEEKEISARKVVKFEASRSLKQRMNDNIKFIK